MSMHTRFKWCAWWYYWKSTNFSDWTNVLL